MPIRKENLKRYPKDWPAISKRIRARAGNKCEECGVPNGAEIVRDSDGEWSLAMSNDKGVVKIVLTCAHLDHTPENIADDNLRAWCQRCHNRYDAPMRAAGIKARRRATMANADLFD